MAKIYSRKETVIKEDADGNITTSVKETTGKVEPSPEPDYIKIYTRMWCEFNGIPEAYRALFMELVTRMTYCSSRDLQHSQLVNTGQPWADAIMQALHWKRAMYQKGLKALCNCEAIRKVGRGVYQINPRYAGKGEWKYNPKYDRGGVEDLVATFSFRDGKVDTTIVWADDGGDSELDQAYREGLGTTAGDGTVLKETVVKPSESSKKRSDTMPGQMLFDTKGQVYEQ